jgi:hypothetical protein
VNGMVAPAPNTYEEVTKQIKNVGPVSTFESHYGDENEENRLLDPELDFMLPKKRGCCKRIICIICCCDTSEIGTLSHISKLNDIEIQMYSTELQKRVQEMERTKNSSGKSVINEIELE